MLSKNRKIPGCRWSQTMCCWYISFREDYLTYLAEQLGNFEIVYKEPPVQYLTFKDIKALGPDERIVDLNPIIVKF